MISTVMVIGFLFNICSVTGNEEPIIEGCQYVQTKSGGVYEFKDQEMLNLTCKMEAVSLAWSIRDKDGNRRCQDEFQKNIDFITLLLTEKDDGYTLSCNYKNQTHPFKIIEQKLLLRYAAGVPNKDENDTNQQNTKRENYELIKQTGNSLCRKAIARSGITKMDPVLELNSSGIKNGDKTVITVAVSSLLLILIIAGIILWYRRNIASLVHGYFNRILKDNRRSNMNKNTNLGVRFEEPQLLTTYSDVNDYVKNTYMEPYVPAVPHYTQAIPKWARKKTNQNQNTTTNSSTLENKIGDDNYEYIGNDNVNKKPGINNDVYADPINVVGKSNTEKKTTGTEDYAYPTTGADNKSENETQDAINYDHADPLCLGRQVGR